MDGAGGGLGWGGFGDVRGVVEGMWEGKLRQNGALCHFCLLIMK